MSKTEYGHLMLTLCVIFMAMKMAGWIEWGWAWVLSPLWLPSAVIAVGIVCLLAVAPFWIAWAWIGRRLQHQLVVPDDLV